MLVADAPLLVDEALSVDGILPPALAGNLYRIGPGLFGPPGRRKRHALDGDGLLQRFYLAEGRVHFRSRFVSTGKFLAEHQAGRSLFPTWSTRASGWWRNVGRARIRSQAGVTVTAVNGRLLARDEVGLPWAVDPQTLDTLGEVADPTDTAQIASGQIVPKAHVKVDPLSGETITLGCAYGRAMRIHVLVQGQDCGGTTRFSLAVPRQVYFHDFFLTERHIVVLLHPAFFSPLPFVLGLSSFSDCLHWRPARGNLWLVMARDGSGTGRYFEGAAAWMWHGLNAFERDGTIIADWVGFDAPDHFLGRAAALRRLMVHQPGKADAPGMLRRTVLGLRSGTIHEEVIADGNFEFPTLSPNGLGRRHHHGYLTVAGKGTILADGIARVDVDSGRLDTHRFGPAIHVGEPLSAMDRAGCEWLLVPGLDGQRGLSFLAVFKADRVSHGPLARAWLSRPMPASFHGAWVADQGRTST